MTSRSKLLSVALSYFEAQQPVIAVGPDKRPYRRGWNEFFSRPQTKSEIEEEFSNGVYGLAKVLYPASDYVHLDFDGDGAEHAWSQTGIILPPSGRVWTPSGGFHLIFRASNLLRSTPELKRAVRLVEAGHSGVDFLVRGYAISPPTPHYREDPDFPIEDAVEIPDEVIRLALNKQRGSKSAITGDIPQGRRDVTLLSIAGALRRQGKDYGEILEKLLQQNEAKCKPPLETRAIEKIAKSVMRYPPGDGNGAEKESSGFCPMTAAELLNKKIPLFPTSWSSIFGKAA